MKASASVQPFDNCINRRCYCIELPLDRPSGAPVFVVDALQQLPRVEAVEVGCRRTNGFGERQLVHAVAIRSALLAPCSARTNDNGRCEPAVVNVALMI
jgi:hypothetical protein